MKRAIIAATAAIALLITAAPAEAARCNQACQMKRLLVTEDPSWRVISNKEIGKLGRTLCSLLDDGLDHVFLVEYMTSEDFEEDWAIQLLAASVVIMCPRHTL